MQPPADRVAAIAGWLRRNVAQTTVESEWFFDAEVTLFRASKSGAASSPELLVSDIVFEDHTDTEIIAVLDRRHVAQRLSDPDHHRLFLTRGLQLGAPPPGPLK